jgi:2-keto-4-pentenoate hydratase/2-oxohepta-3-ene-1,7-dioic acid hydratase in catechol pathway
MKLIRFGKKGAEKPGLLKGEMIVDLREHFPEIPDIGEAFFRQGWPGKVSGLEDPGVRMDVRIGCPISNPSKIICLGKNYAEHAKEGGFDNPEAPLLFSKTPNTLNGPYDPVYLPVSSSQIDWEVELAIIIGKEGKGISMENAFDYIAGFSVLNDVSGRDVQFKDSQWFRGKSFDTFAPMGPSIVTIEEIPDVGNLRLTARVNEEIMQDGNTADMIFDIPYIMEFISRDITLMPGDIVSTGTPSGVGIFRDPPITLKAGDIVECEIETIGSIRNEFVSA